MQKPLILFGTDDTAELAHFYFTTDSAYDVAAFTVDRAYMTADTFCDRPVVAFEDLAAEYAPADHALFVAMGYSGLNAHRKDKYLAAKSAGYDIAGYVSSRATVLNDGKIGENCFILEDNTIQPGVRIGNNVTLWSGNHIGHHSVIGDHCFIASHVVVSGRVTIEEQCFIGVNATLRDHITIGARCLIGAGALILADAEPEGAFVVKGTERARVPSTRLRKI
ncbi:acetyltransferase [uncultured Roseobacter sp.]|uniref:acetyltransferase n=1 Tax=uncultured Roseobacter sp. TaxID=114847 RepID=UPI002628361D|nr:acetyltransferase [uncultured Roseobacter sp.]